MLPRRSPKQPSRQEPQRGEESIQPNYLAGWAIAATLHSGDQRNHGDENLDERHREQRARQTTRPETRDGGTDDPDGEHTAERQVGGVVLGPDTPTARVIQTSTNAAATARQMAAR
jgi:hypothetical protein